jgi:hypothetical protein
MSRDAKFPLRGVMKASGAILRFLNKECTQSNLQEWQQHQSTVLGVKYGKLINIIKTFLKKLPRKYDKMRADWDNGRREYTGFNYPVTVAKAYEMAVRHVGVVAADAGDGRRVFAAARSEGDINDEVRLNAVVDKY